MQKGGLSRGGHMWDPELHDAVLREELISVSRGFFAACYA